MFLLESFDLLSSLNDFLVELSNFLEGLFVSSFRLVQMLFHIASRCDSLDCKPLFPLKLILKIISLGNELVVLLLESFHLLQSFILLVFAFNSESSFSSEHRRKELRIRRNLINILGKLLLVLPRILQPWQVKVIILCQFVFSLFKRLPLCNLIGLHILEVLLDLPQLEIFHLHLTLVLLQLILLVEMVLVVVVLILIQLRIHLLVFVP